MTSRRATLRSALRCGRILIMFTCCAALWDSKAESAPVIAEINAVRHSSQFGYMPSADLESEIITSKKLISSVNSKLESFTGNNITGNILDPELATSISLLRCGVKDSHRTKRYVLQGSKWEKKSLSYRISKYTGQLTRADVDQIISKAFAFWSKYTDLKFSPKRGNVDIEIRFERGDHGDWKAFDGVGGILAHATYPNLRSDVHFDDDEYWTIGKNQGVNLLWTAVHEFGHALGLEHTHITSAVMYGVYNQRHESNFTLDIDDIAGIQKLYGPKTVKHVPRICEDPRIDTMLTSANGNVYVFKGKYYWRLSSYGIADGYPRLIAKSWRGLPRNIDFAFTDKYGATYFMKGSKYWVYNGRRRRPGFPKEIGYDIFETLDEMNRFFYGIKASKRYSSFLMRNICNFFN